MPDISEIQTLIETDRPAQAVRQLETMIARHPGDDQLHYLRGNAYLKMGDWQKAMENYLEAEHLNPQSPATEAYFMAQQIMNFYCKDVYGQ